jgi:hypothetical protein
MVKVGSTQYTALMLISVHSGQLMRGDITGPSDKFWTATYEVIIPLLNPQIMSPVTLQSLTEAT